MADTRHEAFTGPKLNQRIWRLRLLDAENDV
jgi:hypothetical protein